MRNILRDLEFKTILEAEDGNAAFSVLETHEVDLIISDWNMPNCTRAGIPETRAGRRTVQGHSLSDGDGRRAQKENILQAVQAKVSNYIVKPFTAVTLSEKLAKIIPQD